MLQPEYWNWTRNLIVASHFDLQLKDQFQKSFPPFRDSNQTEIYYQILKLFDASNSDIKNTQSSPLIFEIGRNGPVYLHHENNCENKRPFDTIECFFSTPEPSSNNSIHKNYDKQGELKYYLLFICLIAAVLIFTEFEMRPFSGAQIIWLFITTAILLIFMLYAIYDTKGEPLSFTDGVSIWPTILIRILTCFLAFAFIIKLIRALEVSFFELNHRKILLVKLDQELEPLFVNRNRKTFYEIISGNKNCENGANSNKRCLFFRLTLIFIFIGALYAHAVSIFYFAENQYHDAIWLYVILLLLLVVICPFPQVCDQVLSLFRMQKIKETLSYFPFNILLLLSVFIIILITSIICHHPETGWLLGTVALFSLLHHTKIIEIKSIRHWAEKDDDNVVEARQTGKNDSSFIQNQLQQLWKDYRQHGLLEQRILRATFMWLIFMNIDVLLRHLFPESLPLCRGDTCDIDYWIFIISYSSVMFLTFLVLDAQRLCLHWIEKLHTDYSKKSYNNQGSELIKLVADRTEVIDQFIYFPIILLMLMFLSRIVYFDYMNFPLSNGIISGISISLLFYAGLKLRTEASQLKWEVIENAKDQDKMVKELEQFNYGAFQPMSEQPVVRSALLLVGSLGLFAAEYLMLFGY